MPKQECILKIEKKQIKVAAHPLATRGNAATISSKLYSPKTLKYETMIFE